MMGAGNSGASMYQANVNLNTGGGSKKQGITSRVGLTNWSNPAVQTNSNGQGRFKLICVNQLGGVGVGRSMFGGAFTQVRGIPRCTNALTLYMTSLTSLFAEPQSDTLCTIRSVDEFAVLDFKRTLTAQDPDTVVLVPVSGPRFTASVYQTVNKSVVVQKQYVVDILTALGDLTKLALFEAGKPLYLSARME